MWTRWIASWTSSQGVADPEQKRKIIGAEFIRVFEEEARKLEGIEFLAQGTIYPDIIERYQDRRDGQSLITTWAVCRRISSSELVEPLKMLFFRTKSAPAARRSACRTTWFIVSPSRTGSGRALPGRDHPRPLGERSVSPTPSCAKSLTKRPRWKGLAVLHRHPRRQERGRA